MAQARRATDPASRLRALADQHERRFAQVFLDALAVVRDAHTLDALADLLAVGDLEGALSRLQMASRLLGTAYGDAVARSAVSTAQWLSTSALTVTVGFDQVNARAVDAIRQSQLRLIREFSSEMRAVTRAALTDGIERGLNPRDQARAFRESLGLTRRQQMAVQNYRRLLEAGDAEALSRRLRDRRFDRTVARAVSSGEPLGRVTVDRMVGRYQERYVFYRSEVIARTEALRSVHEGHDLMLRQAMEEGHLNQDQVVQRWVAASDGRTRDTHRSMGGQERRVDEPFLSPSGSSLRYPGDPMAPPEETVQCRCTLSTRVFPGADA